jgi:NitT/TauT family transport system ATP-binding protein
MSTSDIEVREISHWFVAPDGHQHGAVHVLDEVSLDIEAGTFVSFLGPSGCGKTTLLRILNGLIKPIRGTVRVDGAIVDRPPPNVGMVFQDHNLLPWRRTLENVEFGLELAGVKAAERRVRAREAIKTVSLEGFERSFPHQLSGGMRQRVGLARALCLNPEILLMDEPYGALDAQTREVMQDQLLQIWERDRKTVVFVTHSIEEAVYLSDRVIVFTARPGRIKADIRINLPRPRGGRGDEVKTSLEAGQYRRDIWQLLKPEMEEIEA